MLMVSIRGCPPTVDTQRHFCPSPRCDYYGWIGLGNIRANGHPGGRRWRQLQCVACGTYFLETHGTPLHGIRQRFAGNWATGATGQKLCVLVDIVTIDFKGFFDILQGLTENYSFRPGSLP
jgi:hypothetical protein